MSWSADNMAIGTFSSTAGLPQRSTAPALIRKTGGGVLDPFRLRILSDLHLGSRWGLWPPDFSAEDEMYPQNDFNAWLWQCWQDMLTYPKADLLVVNGDVLEGRAPKDWGAGIKAVEVDIQQAAALEVLRPAVANATRWMLTKGTAYHESATLAVGKALGASPWPNGDVAGLVLDLSIRGKGVNIAHHPEGGAVLYKGTSLDKAGLWSIISGALGKTVPAQIVVRSHWHFYGSLQSNGVTVIQNPCWQLQTPYAVKKAYYRFQPDIGFVDILIDPEESYPIVQPVLYPLPQKEILEIA